MHTARFACFFLFITISSSTCQNGTCTVQPTNAPQLAFDSGIVFKIFGLQFPASSPSPTATIGATPCTETAWLEDELSCKISLPAVQPWMNSGLGSGPYTYTNTTISISEQSNLTCSTQTVLYGEISFDAPSLIGVGSLSNMQDLEAQWEQSGMDIYGPCSSYAPGGMNYGWCFWDSACGFCRLSCWSECSYVFQGNG